jgi:hypothetical protein
MAYMTGCANLMVIGAKLLQGTAVTGLKSYLIPFTGIAWWAVNPKGHYRCILRGVLVRLISEVGISLL